MRENEDAEQDRADEHSRSEDAQMSESSSLHGYEHKERANGGNIAYHKRREHLLERLTNGGCIALMHEQMQGIIDRYTDEHTAYAEHDGTDCGRDEAQHTHAHEPAERYSEHDQPKVAPARERVREQYNNKHQRESYAQQGVGLDAAGIADRYDRCADPADTKLRIERTDLTGYGVERIDEGSVVAGLGAAVGAIEKRIRAFFI